jgi:hypothetical protein
MESQGHVGVVFLAEAALGETKQAYEPEQFLNGLPDSCHSVYGVGQQKPSIKGLKDLNSVDMELKN